MEVFDKCQRYQLVTVYKDQSSKAEGGDNPIALLETAAIYMRDPDCEGVEIYDFQEERNILDFWRWPIDKPIPECYNRYVRRGDNDEQRVV